MSKRLLQSKTLLATAIAVVAVGIGAGSALAGKYVPSQGCTVTPATSQPFLNWGDSHNYFLAPGGDMESDLSAFGWSLSGGAALVSGNEPWDVTGNPADSMSLALPAGSSAMTPSICVTVHDPELRFFLQNTGVPGSKLDVSAYFIGNDGTPHVKDLAKVKAHSDWALTSPIKFHDAIQPGPDGTGQVSFVFTPTDAKGNWQIDDLYIDPLKSQ
jgi:hypothetical protein